MLVISNKKNFTLTAALAAVCALAVLSGTAARGSASQSPIPSSTPQPSLSALVASSTQTAPIAEPTTQQNVDTHLSLSPLSTPSARSPATPAPSGCTLNLAFDPTGGNPQGSGTVDYTLVAKNLGSTACQSASISIYYADNETFVSATPTPTAAGYYWNLGNLAPGKETDISLVTDRTAAAATAVTVSEACLSASNGSDACSDASRTSTGAAQTPQTAQQSSQAAQTPMLVTTLAPQPGKELGIWVWTPVGEMSPTEMQQVINEVAANNFNVIYLTIDEYLGDAPQSNLTEFLALAAQKNISVDAEAGARTWGDPGHLSEAQQIVSFVQTYNQTHSIKFRGVQFDIEPYLLPNYAGNESQILTQYVALVDQVATQAANDNLPLTIVIPHFYDDIIQWAPEITVDGVTNYPYNQILRILNRTSGNRIIVMAYRNFSVGDNGSIALSQTEVKEADATNVKVLVAQETGPVTPSYVTFSDTSRADLATQAATISQAFGTDSSFGGIAIDYLDPFLMLQ